MVTIDPNDPVGNAERARRAYLESNDPAILDLAVGLGRLAVDFSSPGDSDRVTSLATLGVLLRLSYERSNDRQILAEAVQVGRAAVDEASSDDRGYSLALSSLGNTLQELFGCT
ncbi:MAG: hypothetical protein ACRDRS_21800, partial [Pseudonocardiaceae bacterium]